MSVINYKEILKSKLAERTNKNIQYSLRSFARDIGLSPQRLSHILNGRHGLSVQAAGLVASKLSMNETEKDFFCTLVQKEHSRSKAMRTEAAKRLKNLKFHYKNVELDNFKLISDWYHFAIMELTLIENFSNNCKQIGKSLGISEVEAEMAIERLLKLKLLIKEKKGSLKIRGNFFADPKEIPSEAIRNFHKQLLSKSINAIDFQDLNERDFSSLVVAVDEKDIATAKKEIKKFRESMDRLFSKSKKKTRVYCLGVQLFALQNK